MSHQQGSGIAELTPHTWQAHERNILRAFILCAAEGKFQRAQEHLTGLPHEAMVDLRYALDVMHPIVSEMSGRSLIPSSRVIDGSDRLRVPCGRCGHDISQHTLSWSSQPDSCNGCPDGRCQPVRVPVGVAQTVTVVDGETEVE